MKAICFLFGMLVFVVSNVWSQAIDNKKADPDTTTGAADTITASIVLKPQLRLPTPTMLPLPRLKDNQKSFSVDVGSHYRSSRPEESTNWDAMNKPLDRYDYPFVREAPPILVPVTPQFNPQKDLLKPLPSREYIIPTRPELEILEILWTKEDVQDTTIYSCLDTTLNITMEDLNNLLGRMTRKGFVSRKIVSPRNEFNLFGNLIEMSPTNRRNRIYEYHSLVNRNLMRTFIDANYFLYRNDSSIIDQRQFKMIQNDSTLLKDLNSKLFRAKNE